MGYVLCAVGGLIIGMLIGIVLMSLCIVGSYEDSKMEETYHEKKTV